MFILYSCVVHLFLMFTISLHLQYRMQNHYLLDCLLLFVQPPSSRSLNKHQTSIKVMLYIMPASKVCLPFFRVHMYLCVVAPLQANLLVSCDPRRQLPLPLRQLRSRGEQHLCKGRCTLWRLVATILQLHVFVVGSPWVTFFFPHFEA